MNKVMTSLESFTRYLSQAIARIFSPNEKPMPEIGTQPFDGEAYSKSDFDQTTRNNIKTLPKLNEYQNPWAGTLFPLYIFFVRIVDQPKLIWR